MKPEKETERGLLKLHRVFVQNDVYLRFMIGAMVGCFIGLWITVVIAAIEGDGDYLPAMPQLLRGMPTVLSAVILQYAAFSVIGAVFAEASILLQSEKWSYPVRCLLHFCVTAVFYLPFQWFCYSEVGRVWRMIALLVTVLFVYAVSWWSNYLVLRSDVNRINQKINAMRGNDRGEEKRD